MNHGAYDPPGRQHGRPAVILWFRTYAAVLALLSGAFGGVPVVEHLLRGDEPPLPLFVIVAYALVHAVGVAIPHKPWGWTYGMALIGLGFFSCMLPAAVGLFLYWKEPTTKAAFQRFL